MATLDDILGQGNGSGAASPAKGSQQRAEQNSGANAPEPQSVSQPQLQQAPEQAAQQLQPTSLSETQKDGTVNAVLQPTVKPASGLADMANREGLQYSYEELYKKMNPYKPLSEEEKAKEAKKQKREQIFAAIGDGISALSNLYFTTQYAPSMYDGKNSMSERTRVRYDRLMKEREGKEKEYFAGIMKARMTDEERADRERKWKRLLGIDEYNRRRDEAKDERDRLLFDLDRKLKDNKISAAEADAKRKSIETKYAEELNKGKVETEEAKARYYSTGGSRGGGTPGEYPWYDSDGKKHYAHSYEAMRQNSIDHGTWNETTQTSTTETKNRSGRTQKTTEVTKAAKGHSSKPQKKTGLGLGNGEEKQNNGKKTGLGL